MQIAERNPLIEAEMACIDRELSIQVILVSRPLVGGCSSPMLVGSYLLLMRHVLVYQDGRRSSQVEEKISKNISARRWCPRQSVSRTIGGVQASDFWLKFRES